MLPLSLAFLSPCFISPRRFLLFILILVVLVSPSYAKSKRAKTDSQWKARKRECERSHDLCGSLIPEEAQNCVNKCVASECYDEVYANDPLEDGEIDPERGRSFTACTRKVYRERKRKRERERREDRERSKQDVDAAEDVKVQVELNEVNEANEVTS